MWMVITVNPDNTFFKVVNINVIQIPELNVFPDKNDLKYLLFSGL